MVQHSSEQPALDVIPNECEGSQNQIFKLKFGGHQFFFGGSVVEKIAPFDQRMPKV